MSPAGALRAPTRVGMGTPALCQALQAIPPEGRSGNIKVLGEIGARALREGWLSMPAGSGVAPAVAAPLARDADGQISRPFEPKHGQNDDLFQSLCSNLGIEQP